MPSAAENMLSAAEHISQLRVILSDPEWRILPSSLAFVQTVGELIVSLTDFMSPSGVRYMPCH